MKETFNCALCTIDAVEEEKNSVSLKKNPWCNETSTEPHRIHRTWSWKYMAICEDVCAGKE